MNQRKKFVFQSCKAILLNSQRSIDLIQVHVYNERLLILRLTPLNYSINWHYCAEILLRILSLTLYNFSKIYLKNNYSRKGMILMKYATIKIATTDVIKIDIC